jgi:DNA mismatch repair protein MutH
MTIGAALVSCRRRCPLPRGKPPSPRPRGAPRARMSSPASRWVSARRLEVPVPPDLPRAEGWVGSMFEAVLGATARAHPDFEGLGIELETLPATLQGTPLETTFVCTIPLADMALVEWNRRGARACSLRPRFPVPRTAGSSRSPGVWMEK